ncbi:unnamed protein product, partial [Closterium sp. NIES-53]
CRIGLVMEIARTSMIHAAAPHFLWPFVVRYAAHELNLWPRASLPETSPTLRRTGEVGYASVFWVWGSRAFVCLFGSPPALFLASSLAFPQTLLAGSFTTPPHAVSSPLRTSLLTSVSQVDPLLGVVPMEVAIDSGATRGVASEGAASGGAASGGAEPTCAEPGGAEPEGAGSGGAEPGGAGPGGVEPASAEPGDPEPEGAEPRGAESEGVESRGAAPRGTASSGGLVGASPRLSPRPEPLSPQQMREWFAQRTRLRSGAAGAGGSTTGGTGARGVGATSLGGARVSAGAASPGGARTRGLGVAGTGDVGGAGAGGAGAGDPGAGTPPSDESIEPSGTYPELVGCIITSGMGLVLGGRGLVVLSGHADASWVDELAMQRSSQGYALRLGSGSISWRSTRSSSVLLCICEAEIYARAMAAHELRWPTYLLTNLGERPCSSPVLYVDNKAMIALCQEHRLEHRTKHIALRYFLARELRQRGQLHLAYVATRANTADIFTKAL